MYFYVHSDFVLHILHVCLYTGRCCVCVYMYVCTRAFHHVITTTQANKKCHIVCIFEHVYELTTPIDNRLENGLKINRNCSGKLIRGKIVGTFWFSSICFVQLFVFQFIKYYFVDKKTLTTMGICCYCWKQNGLILDRNTSNVSKRKTKW